MRTPHSGQNTPATSLSLSAMRVNCFVGPVTVRLSFATGMYMPKALPDWRCRIGAGILCSGRQPSVLVPSSIRNALSRIGIRQCRVRACCSLLSKGDDDLTELAALLQIAVHFHHIVELERTIDDRLERAARQTLDDVLDSGLPACLVAGH